jgi:hypothetical protein
MSDYNSEQLNLFTQPIEVLLEQGCTVDRAAELVQSSKSSLYEQLRKNQPYLRKVATGTWKISPTDKKDGLILVNAAFIFSPKDPHWRLA